MNNNKVCSKCGVDKPLEEYHKQKDGKFGVRGDCKVCVNTCKEAYRQNNSGKIKAREKAYYQNNPDKVKASAKAYYQNNSEKIKARKKAYQQNNSDKVNAYNAKRRATKLNATPSWLTGPQEAHIKRTYALATLMKEITGKDHHVDHIIPLNGKNVSGLHVPWNLQVLPADINIAKSNTHNDW